MMETQTLFTNVGCPVEVTGQFPLEPGAQLHVVLPFGEFDGVVRGHLGIYVGVTVDSGDDADALETTRLHRLFYNQDDCPDWNPDELTPGERIAEHTGRIEFQQ